MWTLIDEEAASEGTTTAQFVREAAIIRAVWLRACRGEGDGRLTDINKAVKQLRD